MTKRNVMLITALLVLSVGLALGETTNFRDAKWGMSKAEVQATEKKPLDGMTTQLLDREWHVEWNFVDDKLVKGAYAYIGKDYGIAFKEAKEALGLKYGDRICDWDLCTWDAPDTSIVLFQGVANGGVAITYTSTNLKELVEKFEQQQDKKKRDAARKDTDKL